MKDKLTYCTSYTQYARRKTNQVNIGGLELGSKFPIRVQSMTNTNTQDIEATAAQSMRIIDAGGELVRITAPGINDAEALGEIKKILEDKGYNQPLVADIHFNPNAAFVAAEKVEKVRINPGNFVDKKKFEHIEYTEQEYEDELKRIREKFVPLLKLCKFNNSAIRIGTNHGSLSDRILSRYGDTPLGMVESALEFLRICDEFDFPHVVLSMKASNTHVMVQAYRLLVAKMRKENMNFPLHLGVTEAGEAEDGRIKSAVGIGTLLADGLGDTIRVSLTEDPEAEIPVAIAICDYFEGLEEHRPVEPVEVEFDPFSYSKRKSIAVENIGGDNPVAVVADFTSEPNIDTDTLKNVGYNYISATDKWIAGDQAPEFIFVSTNYIEPNLPASLKLIAEYEVYQELKVRGLDAYPIIDIENYAPKANSKNRINFIRVSYHNLQIDMLKALRNEDNVVLMLEVQDKLKSNTHVNTIAEQRAFFFVLQQLDIKLPVIIKHDYNTQDFEQLQLQASIEFGALFVDGFGDGIMINKRVTNLSYDKINSLAFNILQASRVRTSKTEYISCPSCGRTLFDLQQTTARIRKVTSHLKGLKIGIMGCIVNGPGEMADADYGYVGTGPGKITLYKGQEVVSRNIPSENAVLQLIELIKENGDWVEPPLDTE